MNEVELMVEEAKEQRIGNVELLELTVDELADVGGGTTYVLY